MGIQVNWESSMEKGLARAKAEKKLVLADFFNPG
jgi:hypothetical protein